MAFQQFKFPDVVDELNLNYREANLFAEVAPLDIEPDFMELILDNESLANAINTEKARSEFVIAPVLIQLRRMHNRSFGLFSGVELEADASRGLNGICDFLLTRANLKYVVSLPVLCVAEAKNDQIRSGLGQCIASMVAAQLLNEKAGTPINVYGVVSTGSMWKFLRLDQQDLSSHDPEYHLNDLGKILGILSHIVRSG